MKPFVEFVKTTLMGGLLFLIPVVLAGSSCKTRCTSLTADCSGHPPRCLSRSVVGIAVAAGSGRVRACCSCVS